jgi:hypothetical protein
VSMGSRHGYGRKNVVATAKTKTTVQTCLGGWVSEEDCERRQKEGVRVRRSSCSPGAAIAPVAPTSSNCRDLSASPQVASNASAPVMPQ